MNRKFIGATLLLAVLSLTACGSSSNTASDECTDDPMALACQQEMEEEDAAFAEDE